MQEAETHCGKPTFFFFPKLVLSMLSRIQTVGSMWLTVELLKYVLCYNEYFSLWLYCYVVVCF